MYDSILSNSIQSNGIPFDIVQNDSIPYTQQQYNGLQYDESANLEGFGISLPGGLDSPDAQNKAYNTDNLNNTPQNTVSQPSENCVNRQMRASGGKNKQIKRVIVFYSDGSFEELFPHIR